MIPKIIWQTHEKPYEELPDFQKRIIKTWKDLNPEWDYKYVDSLGRSKQVKEYNKNLYKYYAVSGKLHQSDIWRLVVTYTYGGFYADMDSICVKSIDESLYKNYNGQDLVCSPQGFQHDGINSSNFGSKKNSKIIKLIINSLIQQYKNTKIENIPNFHFGFPENHTFSIIAQKNKDDIFFNNEYFIHSKDFKTEYNG